MATAEARRGTAVVALVAEVSTTSSCWISISSREEGRGYYALQTTARTRSRGVSGELGKRFEKDGGQRYVAGTFH